MIELLRVPNKTVTRREEQSLKEYLHSVILTILCLLIRTLGCFKLRSVGSHNLHVNSVLWVYLIEMFAVKVMLL